MHGRCLELATRARRSDRSLPQTLSGRSERRFHSATRLGCLHSRKERIEFLAERIELGLGCARERVEVLDGNQDGLGRVVLRDRQPSFHRIAECLDVFADSLITRYD